MIAPFPKGIDVVVVTYNSSSHIPALARALRDFREIGSITLVDNGSTDGSREIAQEQDWGTPVEVVHNPSNPGFGASMNFGALRVDKLRHDQILILNPDVVLSASALESLSRILAENTDIATVGPVLATPAGVPVSSARHFPTPRSIALRQIFDVRHDGVLTDVDWICGASMLWRRSAFEELGGFSPEYFLYFEDVDICRRAVERGWRVALAGTVNAVHDQGHGRKTPPHLKRASRASRRVYARSWFGLQGLLASAFADAADMAADYYHTKRGQRL